MTEAYLRTCLAVRRERRRAIGNVADDDLYRSATHYARQHVATLRHASRRPPKRQPPAMTAADHARYLGVTVAEYLDQAD